MFEEDTRVVLTRTLSSLGLEPGDVGVVVHIYANGAAYEVEFLSSDGSTIGVSTVDFESLTAEQNAVISRAERAQRGETVSSILTPPEAEQGGDTLEPK